MTCKKCMEEDSYNDWTNYETWLVWTHLFNSKALTKVAARIINNSKCEKVNKIVDTLCNFVCSYVAFDVKDIKSGFRTDLLNATLDRVNWIEIINMIRLKKSN